MRGVTFKQLIGSSHMPLWLHVSLSFAEGFLTLVLPDEEVGSGDQGRWVEKHLFFNTLWTCWLSASDRMGCPCPKNTSSSAFLAFLHLWIHLPDLESTLHWQRLSHFSMQKQTGWVQIWLWKKHLNTTSLKLFPKCHSALASLLCDSGATSWQELTSGATRSRNKIHPTRKVMTARRTCSSWAGSWTQAADWVLKGRDNVRCRRVCSVL